MQATGHGTLVACDGGLLLSTARMGEVLVDPEGRTATAGPGVLWSDVLASAPYQLAPLSGRANSVGVAGYTLGGGTGWLSRKHGFAADSVLWAEVVTAGGEKLTASATEHPDLFWALRGGNFGVVTRLRFNCTRWRGSTRACPGTRPTGRPRLLDRFGPAGFAEASQAAAGPPLPPMAVRDHLDLFRQVPDSALDAMVEAAADPGSPLAFAELRHWGGAMARPSPDAGPVGHPDLPFSIAAMAPYDRGHQPERLDAAMDRLVAGLRPEAPAAARS